MSRVWHFLSRPKSARAGGSLLKTPTPIAAGAQRGNKADRNGFTLLEVLLAVGISMLAMAAVYAAMGIHLRFIEAGDNDVERAQLARAVLGRIAEDLRATVFHSSNPLAGETSGTLEKPFLPPGSNTQQRHVGSGSKRTQSNYPGLGRVI